MPETDPPLTLSFPPGIRRDGGPLEGQECTDAQWTTFDRGIPRKMRGFIKITDLLDGPVYGMHTQPIPSYTEVHTGTADAVERMVITPSYAVTVPVPRTPAAFVSSPNNLWNFEVMYDATGVSSVILAHAVPSLLDITSETQRPIYYGPTNSTSQLVNTNIPTAAGVCGGIASLPPYMFVFCKNGYITWTAPNNPLSVATADGGGGPNGVRVATTKIVHGLQIRGGPGGSPAGLFWSLNAVIKATFVGDPLVFSFDALATETTILSTRSPVPYDGSVYWIATDRFMMYNGSVREVPNLLNKDWFFDNLNWSQRQKVFGFKVPGKGEIWWCFPFGNATVCTHAIIYNTRYNVWYDTVLPNGGRTSGFAPIFYPYPLLTGATPAPSSGYRLWQHEFGIDEVEDGQVRAVRSCFETTPLGLSGDQQPSNRSLQISMIEPAFKQTGPMTVTIGGSFTPKGPVTYSVPFTFEPDTQVVTPKQTRRLLTLTFESNVAGGNFELGKTKAHLRATDGRTTG